LHLAEHAAYDRIEVARAARRFPTILRELAAGAVTLTTIRLLAPHLTVENHAALLAEARRRTRREVEQIVARLRPRPRRAEHSPEAAEAATTTMARHATSLEQRGERGAGGRRRSATAHAAATRRAACCPIAATARPGTDTSSRGGAAGTHPL